jgi:hypothetical protein
MSAQKFEAFLAKLYVDEQARARFLADPLRQALNAGLTKDECAALEQIDLIGLELAASSFARKKASRPSRRAVWNLPRWLSKAYAKLAGQSLQRLGLRRRELVRD